MHRLTRALVAAAAVAVAGPSAARALQPRPTEADTLRAAIRRSVASGDSAALAEAHNRLGLVHWGEARFDSALVHLREARAVWAARGDSVGLGRVYNNLGVTYYQLGQLAPALDSYRRSQALRRGLGDLRGASLALTNISRVYFEWGLFDLAHEALVEAISAADESGDAWIRAYSRHNLGLLLVEQGDAAGARAAFEASSALYGDPASGLSEAEARDGRGMNRIGLARVLLLEGDAPGAARILEESLGASGEEAATARQIEALLDLGRAYRSQGDLARAEATLDRTLELALAGGRRAAALGVLAAISETREARGDLRGALEAARARTALRDSLEAEDAAQQLEALEYRLEGERQADENRSLREEARRHEDTIALQRLGFLLGGGLLLVSGLLVAALVHFNREGRERERLLQEANRELTDALAEVRTLSGLIPICARCKKVRDDRGFWESVESYVSSRSEALFSHGVCDECGPLLYGEEWHAAVVGGTREPGEPGADPTPGPSGPS